MPVPVDCSAETPILHSGIIPPKKPPRLRGILFGFLIGIVFGAVPMSAIARGNDNLWGYLVFALYIPAIVTALIVHECGHLLAGWMVGFRFSSIAIGPVAFSLEYGKLKLQIRKGFPAGGYAGMHIDGIRRLRRRLAVFVMAGPAANLISALLSAPLAKSYRAGTWSTFAYVFAMISVMIGLVNLIPVRLGVMYPDGSRLWMLISSLTKSRRWFSLNALSAQSRRGTRPRAFRCTWLNAAASVDDRSIDDFGGNWLAYVAANDRKDSRAAALHFEKCLSLVSSLGASLQDLVAVEAAVFTAWFGDNALLSEKWLGQVKNFKALPRLMQIRAEAATLCTRRDFDSALARLVEALVFVENLPPTAIRDKLTDGLIEWREEIRERARSLNSVTEDVSMIPIG